MCVLKHILTHDKGEDHGCKIIPENSFPSLVSSSDEVSSKPSTACDNTATNAFLKASNPTWR